jgi:hypothetical protein
MAKGGFGRLFFAQGLCTPWRLVYTATRLSPVAAYGRLLLLDAAAPYTLSARASTKVDVRPLIAHHFTRAGRRCIQRSGIKEESLAIGQHGGQPRS